MILLNIKLDQNNITFYSQKFKTVIHPCSFDNYLSRLNNHHIDHKTSPQNPFNITYYPSISFPYLYPKKQMQIEQFKFILQDTKTQIQQLPSLQSLLKLTQKTTKKLQCLNLYSQIDKRDFDLQIQQQNIYTQIQELYKAINAVKQESPTQEQVEIIMARIQQIKTKYMRTFDVLAKQEDILNQELAIMEKILQADQKKDQINQIKELDEYEDQGFEPDQQHQTDPYHQLQAGFDHPRARVQQLKLQIQTIHKKIAHINSGKGKWFQTDHKDFVKIYNKCQGNGKKIITEAIKVLGMNQAQIMDHLQLYQSYLQLQKQKKLVSEQYKQIKFFEKEEERERQEQKDQLKKLQLQVKKDKQMEERLRKKEEVERYKQKKAEEKERMIQKEEESKVKPKMPPLQQSKKKEIMERNRQFIENQQKKLIQAKIRKQSMDKSSGQKGRLPSSNKNIKKA